MVMAGRSVHLTTFFSWASLNKQFYQYFAFVQGEEANYFMHITPLLHHTLKYHVFENIMENGAFAL